MKNSDNLTTDVKFKNAECQGTRTLENQDNKIIDCSYQQVIDYLYEMFDYYNEFVILTVANMKCGVRYIQAVMEKGQILIQLGIEETDYTRLVEKIFSQEECIDVFSEFYESSFVHNIESYKPVKFFK